MEFILIIKEGLGSRDSKSEFKIIVQNQHGAERLKVVIYFVNCSN